MEEGIGRAYLPEKDLVIGENRAGDAAGALVARRRFVVEIDQVAVGSGQGSPQPCDNASCRRPVGFHHQGAHLAAAIGELWDQVHKYRDLAAGVG
jgi:hypothetical protein